MASESIEILIEADNRASAKFKQVNKDMEASVKNIREVGGKAKASTELVGTLATSLGGSGLGNFASQIAMMTERVSAFSEVAKTGGAGATAFKVGLAGVVAVAGFQLGKALGDAVFQTDRLRREFEDATAKSNEFAQSLAGVADKRFGEQLEDLRAIEDLSLRRAAAEAKIEALQKAQGTRYEQINKLTEEIEGRTETWSGWVASVWGEYELTTEILKEQLETTEQNFKQFEKQKSVLQEMAVAERERLQAQDKRIQQEASNYQRSLERLVALREEVALLKATKDERFVLESRKGTVVDHERPVERLLRERDAILAKREAEKTAEREREQAQQRLVRMQEQAAAADRRAKENTLRGQMSVLDGLRMQVVELQHGKQAAQELALVSKGFSQSDASALAGIMQQLAGGDGFSLSTGVQAQQSRLLTRGRDENLAMKTEKNTALAADELKRLRTHLERQQQQIIELTRGNV